MNLKVCAVVVTYNRKELLEECLEALLNQTFPLNKIYLIDNASTDGTGGMVCERFAENKIIDYQCLEKNIGGAGGFSTGIRIANTVGYDWIWIMDDDTIPDQDCLERLIDASDSLKNASFFASSVYGLNNSPMNVPGIALNSIDENGYGKYLKFLNNKLVEIESATFVSILVNGKAVRKVGIPCAFFFIWGDDMEYTLRLTRYFGPAYIVGDSKALHKRMGGVNLSIFKETDKNRILFNRYSVRNMLIISKEYFGYRRLIYEFIRKIILIFKLLFSRTEKKMIKIETIINGIGDFVLKRYDVKEFSDRMTRLKY